MSEYEFCVRVAEHETLSLKNFTNGFFENTYYLEANNEFTLGIAAEDGVTLVTPRLLSRSDNKSFMDAGLIELTPQKIDLTQTITNRRLPSDIRLSFFTLGHSAFLSYPLVLRYKPLPSAFLADAGDTFIFGLMTPEHVKCFSSFKNTLITPKSHQRSSADWLAKRPRSQRSSDNMATLSNPLSLAIA